MDHWLQVKLTACTDNCEILWGNSLANFIIIEKVDNMLWEKNIMG